MPKPAPVTNKRKLIAETESESEMSETQMEETEEEKNSSENENDDDDGEDISEEDESPKLTKKEEKKLKDQETISNLKNTIKEELSQMTFEEIAKYQAKLGLKK